MIDYYVCIHECKKDIFRLQHQPQKPRSSENLTKTAAVWSSFHDLTNLRSGFGWDLNTTADKIQNCAAV